MYASEAEFRAMLRRAQLVSLDDSGAQQLLDLTGLKSDAPRKVPRVMPFGLASSPPAGASFVLLALGGGGSRLVAIGGEHQAYRPKNISLGGTIVYDAFGNAVSIVQANIRIVHATEVSIESPLVTIKGALTVTKTFNVQNEDGVSVPAEITGDANFTGEVTANGVSVSGHVHGDVQPGGGTTGPATG